MLNPCVNGATGSTGGVVAARVVASGNVALIAARKGMEITGLVRGGIGCCRRRPGGTPTVRPC